MGKAKDCAKIISWALWDWGSAAFNALATTFVFTVFLTTKDLFAPGDHATTVLSMCLMVAGVVIALFAPVTGQTADRKGRGTIMLGIFSACVTLCLFAMFFVYPNSPIGKTNALWLGAGLLALGTVLFEFGSVNYNAMLTRVSNKDNMGRISGLGWGMGYLGGIFLLGLVYVGFIAPKVGWFGVTSENSMNIRVVMLFAALWFGIFSLPVLIALPGVHKGKDGKLHMLNMHGMEDDEALPEDKENFFKRLIGAYRHLFNTIKTLWHEDTNTIVFMIASAVFRDGLAGVFTYDAILGSTVFGLKASEILIFGIISNVVAGLATMLFGFLDDWLGPKNVILLSLGAMVLCGLGLFFFHDGGKLIFWSFGLFLCVFVGPTQSASRSYLARVAPVGREGELFGLYATAGRAVSVLAPALFTLFVWIGAHFFVPAPQSAQYWGVLGITSLVLIGFLMTLKVEKR